MTTAKKAKTPRKKKAPILLKDLAAAPAESTPPTAPTQESANQGAYDFVAESHQSPLQQAWSKIEDRFPFLETLWERAKTLEQQLPLSAGLKKLRSAPARVVKLARDGQERLTALLPELASILRRLKQRRA